MPSRSFEIHRDRLQKVVDQLRSDQASLDAEFSRHSISLTQAYEKKLSDLQIVTAERSRKIERTLERIAPIVTALGVESDECIRKETNALKREIKRLTAELEKAKANSPITEVAEVQVGLEKAKTLAIYDAILFAMDNWSSDGQTAPDFSLACQSILFPVVYERVMSNNTDYYVETVPPAALEIVKRGRELISYIRSSSDVSLVDPDAWSNFSGMIQKWWVSDALPLIYGARDSSWDDDSPFSLVEMEEWRDQPASRALNFPLIFDGMELIARFRDEIRETTGLPEFTKATMTTRLEVL